LRVLIWTGGAAIALALAGVIGIALSSSAHDETANGGGVVLPPASSTLKAGDRAPQHFSLAALGGGTAVDLAKLMHGRPAVVNFFASWCPLCASELDAFAQVWRSDRSRVVFVGIDTQDPDKSKALALLRAAGADYVTGIDPSTNAVSDAYGVSTGLPATFFIDAEGRIRFEVLGAENRSALTKRVDALISGKQPARA
jgi:peroxiredoxin